MNVRGFFFGRCDYRTAPENAARLLNVFAEYGIIYAGFGCDEKGNCAFSVLLSERKRLERVCKAAGIKIIGVKNTGLPFLIYKYRKRCGLMLGFLCAVITVIMSGMFVWDVRVTGNRSVSKSDVVSALSDVGFGVGSYIPKADTDSVENRFLLSGEEYGWISINIKGTVAEVEVVERLNPPVDDAEIMKSPANIIAAKDAQIESILAYHGRAVVKRGQTVRRGELLISGVYDSVITGYGYTRAAGEVMGITVNEIEIAVPFEYETKVYTGERKYKRVLNFFALEMTVFDNTAKAGSDSEIKETQSDGFLGDKDSVKLPLTLRTIIYNEYELRTVRRTETEAIYAAFEMLGEKISNDFTGTQLLYKKTETEINDSGVILRCTLRCVENIAKLSEFDVTENPLPPEN